eukprot:8644971-Pyramimonas_sp.AAC.1
MGSQQRSFQMFSFLPEILTYLGNGLNHGPGAGDAAMLPLQVTDRHILSCQVHEALEAAAPKLTEANRHLSRHEPLGVTLRNPSSPLKSAHYSPRRAADLRPGKLWKLPK